MEKMKQKIILAALLHDIGKFWQRADQLLNHPNSGIKQKNADWSWLVPYSDYGKPTRQHAIWTYQFFQNHRKKFADLGLWSEEENSLINLAGKHHSPQSSIQSVITMADQWSSAIDRRNTDEEEPGEVKKDGINWGNYAYKSIPLNPVFDSIRIREETTGQFSVNPLHNAFHLNPLSLENEVIHPYRLDENKVDTLKKNTLQEEYRALWEAFEKEFDHLPTGSFSAFINSLLALLKKYTWCIPSSTTDMPNVNLYEHLKTTAGLAGCLYDYFAFASPEILEGKGRELPLLPDEDPVLLCCCDLSGIQRFIYDIASSKAFKSLKGRSFYLQHLLSGMVDYTLGHTGQSKANILYASGGKAYFLLPNTPRYRDIFKVLRAGIEEELWEEHKGVLYLAFSHVSFRYNLVKEQDKYKLAIGSNDQNLSRPVEELGHLWREVSDRASAWKRKKFSDLFLEKFGLFFGANQGNTRIGLEEKWNTETEICAVSGEFIPKGNAKNIGKEDETVWVSETVERQVKLGDFLKRSSHILQVNVENSAPPRIKEASARIPFLKLGLYSYLFEHDDDREFSGLPEGTLFQFNDTEFLPENASRSTAGFEFLFYGGNEQPSILEKGRERTRTLEELCFLDSDNGEYTKLGVLRMDVDNLGKIFIHGLPEKDKSFAAYATLSAQLDLFFSGFINTIRENYKDHIMIVYSGGDDLFVVGRWDKVLEFSAAVRREFYKFTGCRKDIGISAGLAIVDRKFPIYKAAEMAGEAEEKAKGYKNPKLGNKNAISFFEQTVSWEKEFDEVEKLKNILLQLCLESGMSKSLLQQLQLYHAKKVFNAELIRQGKEPDLSYKWHQAYYLKRFAEREAKKEQVADFALDLSKKLLYNAEFGTERYLELSALAARWAEYCLKDIVNKNTDQYE